MPRPRKWRFVCCLPEWDRFGPIDGPEDESNAVHMTVEEYEAIRLIDVEDLTQEECAERMNVARTTVQGMYNDARKKIAQCLIYGKVLYIKGGDYRLCDGYSEVCGNGNCMRRHRGALRGNRQRHKDQG